MLNPDNDKPVTYSNALRHLQAPLARHLKAPPNWVVWKWIKKNGKWTKPPFIATSPDRPAKNNDPTTWCSYDQACTTVENGKADGIGFCLLGTNISAFDIDDCRNPETMEIHPFALELVKRANSYTEVTVSGTGLRIIGTGSNRELHRKLKASNAAISVEFYRNTARYITISNLPLPDVTTELSDIDALLDTVLAELDKRRPTPATPQEEITTDDTTNGPDIYEEASLPDDLAALIRVGLWEGRKVPIGERSDQFFHAVGWLKDEGWTPAGIFALMQKHPKGIAEKYSASARRLKNEIQRDYDKARAADKEPRDFESILAEIGDGPGLKGFKDVLSRAAEAHVAKHKGEQFDHEALKAQLREAINNAPKKDSRKASEINRYLSNRYLGDCIHSAIKKFSHSTFDHAQRTTYEQPSDLRLTIPHPANDGPWLPVICKIDEVLSASSAAKPPSRDIEGYMVVARKVRIPKTHAFTEQEKSSDDLLPPEQWILSRLDETAVAELIERHINFINFKKRRCICKWHSSATTSSATKARCRP